MRRYERYAVIVIRAAIELRAHRAVSERSGADPIARPVQCGVEADAVRVARRVAVLEGGGVVIDLVVHVHVIERERSQPFVGDAGLCADLEVEAGFWGESEIRCARTCEDLVDERCMIEAPCLGVNLGGFSGSIEQGGFNSRLTLAV